MLFYSSASSFARTLLALLCVFGLGVIVASPCQAQPGTTPVVVSPLPVGTEASGIFPAGDASYKATITSESQVGSAQILKLQIKKGEETGGTVNFNIDVLAANQRFIATPIAPNVLFISGQVMLAPPGTGAPASSTFLSGVLYREKAGDPLVFKGIGLKNSTKAYSSDPCADDPDDLTFVN